MKNLILCICVLILAFQSSSASVGKQFLKNAVGPTRFEDDLEACVTEYNATNKLDYLYEEKDIMINLHTKPENEERTRKNGCIIACFLKKQNLMEGATIKEANVHALIHKTLGGSYAEAIVQRYLRKCMKQVRSMTDECEKSFSLNVCCAKILHKLQGHEEHEREESEEETEENAETEE